MEEVLKDQVLDLKVIKDHKDIMVLLVVKVIKDHKDMVHMPHLLDLKVLKEQAQDLKVLKVIMDQKVLMVLMVLKDIKDHKEVVD